MSALRLTGTAKSEPILVRLLRRTRSLTASGTAWRKRRNRSRSAADVANHDASSSAPELPAARAMRLRHLRPPPLPARSAARPALRSRNFREPRRAAGRARLHPHIPACAGPGHRRHASTAVERRRVGIEKHHPVKRTSCTGSRVSFRFRDHAQRALRADEQIQVIHAGAQIIARGILGARGRRQSRAASNGGFSPRRSLRISPLASTTFSARTCRRVSP